MYAPERKTEVLAIKTRLNALFVLALIFLVPRPSGAQDHLVFSFPQNALEIQGMIGKRLLEEAYSRLGMDFEFRKLPIERALYMANQGSTDGEFLRIAGIEQRYPNLVMVPFALQSMDIMVFTKEKVFEVKGWQSLAPYTIGIVRGFKLAEAKTENLRVEMVVTIEQAFLKLDMGRNDVVVDLRSAKCRLKNLPVSGIKVLDPPLERVPMYHYLNKRHTALASKLESVIMRMEKEGAVQTIQEQAMQEVEALCGQ